jgi:hypothetical protein
MTNVARSLLLAAGLISLGTVGAAATPAGGVTVVGGGNDLVQDVRLVCDQFGRCFHRRGYYGGPAYPYVRPYYGYNRGYYGYAPGYGYGGPGYGYGGPGIGFGFGFGRFGFGFGPGWW